VGYDTVQSVIQCFGRILCLCPRCNRNGHNLILLVSCRKRLCDRLISRPSISVTYVIKASCFRRSSELEHIWGGGFKTQDRRNNTGNPRACFGQQDFTAPPLFLAFTFLNVKWKILCSNPLFVSVMLTMQEFGFVVVYFTLLSLSQTINVEWLSP
jgi:hypothetical protein